MSMWARWELADILEGRTLNSGVRKLCLYQLWLHLTASKRSPQHTPRHHHQRVVWTSRQLVSCLKAETGHRGGFHLAALTHDCIMTAASADILPMFQERKKRRGKKAGCMICPLLKSFLRSPTQWLLPGVGHMATLSSKRVWEGDYFNWAYCRPEPNLVSIIKGDLEMAIGEAASRVCH